LVVFIGFNLGQRKAEIHDLISHPVDLTHTTKTKNKLRTGAQKDRKDANAARKAK